MAASTGWAAQILAGMGAQATANNILKMQAWNGAEGNKPWNGQLNGGGSGFGLNNPFNTTLVMGGSQMAVGPLSATCPSTNVSGCYVQAYPSLQTGIQATVSTMKSSYYNAIVQNLRQNGSAAAFANAVGSSGWGTSGAGILAWIGLIQTGVMPSGQPSAGSPVTGQTPPDTSQTSPPSGPTGGCTTFTPAQLAGIWIQAGGPPTVAPLAAAVAMAESGGNSCAQGSNPGSVDRGLWQMNSKYNPSGSTFDVMTNARAAVALYKSSGNSFKQWCTAWNGGCCSCGTYLGPGSPALKFYNANLQPDCSAPINPTQAVTPTGTPTGGTTPASTSTATATSAGSWLSCFLDPAPCWLNALGLGGGSVSKEDMGLLGGIGSIFNPLAWINSAINSLLNPIVQLISGIMGLTAGAVLMIIGLLIIASNTQTGQNVQRQAGRAGQLAMWAAGPEVGATSTIYESEAGRTVTTRTPGRKPIMGFGGQPGRVTSQRQYASRAPSQQIYETPAKGGGTQRTTITRNYDQGRVASTKTTREVLRDEARKNAGNGSRNNGNGNGS
jgi:Lysozyme like domain